MKITRKDKKEDFVPYSITIEFESRDDVYDMVNCVQAAITQLKVQGRPSQWVDDHDCNHVETMRRIDIVKKFLSKILNKS